MIPAVVERPHQAQKSRDADHGPAQHRHERSEEEKR